MNNQRTICVVTGSRAEYGLLTPLMKEIEATKDLCLQVVVTGTHLSKDFGETFTVIEEDGFKIDSKVNILMDLDDEVSVSKSIGRAVSGISESFFKLKPDIIILLGDRFEILAAAIAATVLKIPIAHIHGGETTEGSFDESFRHSITKMSHFHFTSVEDYRKRVIQLGEDPKKVFNFGAIGIDSINNTKLLSRNEFEKKVGLSLNKTNFLITFHPVTLESGSTGSQFQTLLKALDKILEVSLFFSYANADTGGSIINKMIDKYVSENSAKAIVRKSYGQLLHLSAMQYMDAMIGNSSSGIIEAPHFKIGSINIGDRQLGRIQASSVINCPPTEAGILEAIETLFSKVFQKNLKNIVNPYGSGGAAKNIMQELRSQSLTGILKKKFNDISH